MGHPRYLALTALVFAAVATRLAPHPPNVTPLTAIALLGVATFAGRSAAVLVSLGALLASDGALQLAYELGWQRTPGFYAGQGIVYVGFLAAVGIGFLLRPRPTLARAGLASLAASMVFFRATNRVWAYGPYSLYPRTAAGLLTSYESALPFFRNSLAGDLAFTMVLFGTCSWAERRYPALRGAEARVASA